MSLKTLIKASFVQTIYFLKNVRAMFAVYILWPYLMLGLILGAGFMFGSASSFKQKVGVNVDPVVFFIASTVVSLVSISVMWGIAGSVLELRWIGALPYVMLAPHRFSITIVVSYIPSYLLISAMQILEFAPLIIFIEGWQMGLFKIAILFLALIIGMLPLMGFSALFASILISIREESNVLSWLNPIILLFSGAFYPAYLLPRWAQFISWLLPSTYTIELARLSALIGAPKLSTITFMIGILLGMTLIYNSIASALMGAGERKALREGIIE